MVLELVTGALVKYENKKDIVIGRGVSIGYGTIIHVTNEKSISKDSSLVIGFNTAINEYCNIRASGANVEIGNNCMIAQFVSIIGSNHVIDTHNTMLDELWCDKNNYVNIGNNVWIGCNSVILPGVTISDGAVIAAGSIVTKDVGVDEVVAGNPARILRYRKLIIWVVLLMVNSVAVIFTSNILGGHELMALELFHDSLIEYHFYVPNNNSKLIAEMDKRGRRFSTHEILHKRLDILHAFFNPLQMICCARFLNDIRTKHSQIVIVQGDIEHGGCIYYSV